MKIKRRYTLINKHNQTLHINFIENEKGFKKIGINEICFETPKLKFTDLETFKNLKKIRTYFLKSNSPMPSSWARGLNPNKTFKSLNLNN